MAARAGRKAKMRTCSIGDCAGGHYARGLCKKHHQRQWLHGTTELRPRRDTRRPLADRIADLTKWNGDCLEWQGHRAHFGHGTIWVNGRTLQAHRVSYEIHKGPIPEGLVVRHKCDNPPCVNPDHLEVGTPADNMRDREERGRNMRGENNPAARLTAELVREIRASRDLPRKELVRKYGVGKTQIYRILRGECWPGV